jgi:membrane-bound lytic murein transglycosylase
MAKEFKLDMQIKMDTPYRSMGRALIRAGELQRGKVSMQSIKKWAKNNKKKLRKFLSANPSYVFFRILPEGLPGPIGALGVPITSERSVAIDRKVCTTWCTYFSERQLSQILISL